MPPPDTGPGRDPGRPHGRPALPPPSPYGARLFSLLLKLGIKAEDASALMDDLLITPVDKRVDRAASQLQELFRGYRRCDLPDGTVRWERVPRSPDRRVRPGLGRRRVDAWGGPAQSEAMPDVNPPPFLGVVAACSLPFAIRWWLARRRGAIPRPLGGRLQGMSWFVAGSGFGQLAMAYAVATELPAELTVALRMGSAVLAVIATGVAYALAGPDPPPGAVRLLLAEARNDLFGKRQPPTA